MNTDHYDIPLFRGRNTICLNARRQTHKHMFTDNRPLVIQGGMGPYVSTPFLARTTSMCGALGTFSGVAAPLILIRILQRGDPGGHYRLALSQFPYQEHVQPILDEYFVEGGIPMDTPFKMVSPYTLKPSRFLTSLTIVSTFSMAWLALYDENGIRHNGLISVNFLEKMQMPHIASFVGVMMAGVDCITMGAGIALQVPGILDSLSQHGIGTYKIDVEGKKNSTQPMSFSWTEFFGTPFPGLKRPAFIPIISSVSLGEVFLGKRATGASQGAVLETSTAGGHNAPPRGRPVILNEFGEPVYGERDVADLHKMVALGIPIWIGGSYASPELLQKVRAIGLAGIQVGTMFALSRESGLAPQYTHEARKQGFNNALRIRTDPQASPTGFPFKVAPIAGTLYDTTVFDNRQRVCNQCYLRTLFVKEDDSIIYRCPAEPIDNYLRKNGTLEDAQNARCLCNGLIAAAAIVAPGITEPLSLGDVDEPAIITLGDDLSFLKHLMKDENSTYSAATALQYLMGS